MDIAVGILVVAMTLIGVSIFILVCALFFGMDDETTAIFSVVAPFLLGLAVMLSAGFYNWGKYGKFIPIPPPLSQPEAPSGPQVPTVAGSVEVGE
jgi:hypothetical protein